MKRFKLERKFNSLGQKVGATLLEKDGDECQHYGEFIKTLEPSF